MRNFNFQHMKSSPSSYGVWVGKHNTRKTESTEQIQYVSEVKQHHGWSRGSGVANDICILTLKSEHELEYDRKDFFAFHRNRNAEN